MAMASMLLWARAAASRRAASASPPLGTRGLSSHGGDNSAAAAAPPPRSTDLPGEIRQGRVEFVADDKDLASDEALWALYERWCKAYGVERSHDEMLRRFGHFKDTALLVDRANKASIRDGSSARFAIDSFADENLHAHHIFAAS